LSWIKPPLQLLEDNLDKQASNISLPSSAQILLCNSVMLRRAIRWLHAMIIILALSACQPSTATFAPQQIFPTDTTNPLISATPSNLATPTIGLTLEPEFSPSPVYSGTATSTVVPDPLQFINPTESPIPVTDWRPPLYPIPWAPAPYDHFYFASPIAANEINIPVADYRYGGVFFQDVVHTGVDIPAPKGTPVLAAGPGTVVWAGYGVYRGGFDPTDPYGLAVTIRHDFGYQNQMLYTIYGHLDRVDVAEGQHVETGDPLGLVGETGKVTGPHLHFEVRIGENNYFTTRNPELWLVPPIGWGVIAGRVTNTGGQPLNDQMIVITDPQKEQNWLAWSYGKTSVNSDRYYQENLVVGDMPAGTYLIRVAFGGVFFSANIEVHPGLVNYFTFTGYKGISIQTPAPPGAEFTPPALETPAP
jgi:murein DD-endopeptidase MepM/ murein hydrolase activator NlpD